VGVALGDRRAPRRTVAAQPPGVRASWLVFISHADTALEAWLRAALPLSEEVGDVSFDAPNGQWSAQLSRITVSLFLYDVSRSTRPAAAAQLRRAPDGTVETRRRPLPMMTLSYLVSAWAGSPRDEHQLLSDVVGLLAATDAVPAEFLADDAVSGIQLQLGDERAVPRELWTAAGGQLKASTLLQATVAADAFDWEAAAPPVERLAAMARRMDDATEGGARAR